LTACLEKTVLSEKMIEDDLSRVEESVTKSTYKLGIGFERFEDKSEKNAPKFIVMSFLIFCLALSLAVHVALLLMLCHVCLMDLTITHMVLVHERTILCLDDLDMTHVLIVVIISCVGLVFLPELITLTLSLDIWTVHIFPVVV
jgi:hypothetical protein